MFKLKQSTQKNAKKLKKVLAIYHEIIISLTFNKYQKYLIKLYLMKFQILNIFNKQKKSLKI